MSEDLYQMLIYIYLKPKFINVMNKNNMLLYNAELINYFISA